MPLGAGNPEEEEHGTSRDGETCGNEDVCKRYGSKVEIQNSVWGGGENWAFEDKQKFTRRRGRRNL